MNTPKKRTKKGVLQKEKTDPVHSGGTPLLIQKLCTCFLVYPDSQRVMPSLWGLAHCNGLAELVILIYWSCGGGCSYCHCQLSCFAHCGSKRTTKREALAAVIFRCVHLSLRSSFAAVISLPRRHAAQTFDGELQILLLSTY